MITVFTPTYNRGHLLPRLYESLCEQDCTDFEWLVIDDGSVDDTQEKVGNWVKEGQTFPIRYYRVKNGGKQRAINMAMELAQGEYFFIVDSDDALAADAISFIKNAFRTLPDDNSFIGISGLRVNLDGSYIHRIPLIESSVGYVDCSNLERSQFNLQGDMAEVFFLDKLKQYKFPAWEGETFTPEAVIWDQMALDGYRFRWFNAPIYYCDYQSAGLTNSTWSLLKRNPMGYAMLFNTKLLYIKRGRINTILQFISCCCLAREYGYITHCNSYWVYLLFPIGWLISLRRRVQFKKYVA